MGAVERFHRPAPIWKRFHRSSILQWPNRLLCLLWWLPFQVSAFSFVYPFAYLLSDSGISYGVPYVNTFWEREKTISSASDPVYRSANNSYHKQQPFHCGFYLFLAISFRLFLGLSHNTIENSWTNYPVFQPLFSLASRYQMCYIFRIEKGKARDTRPTLK